MTCIVHDMCPKERRCKQCGMSETEKVMRGNYQKLHRRVQQAESKQLAEIVRPLHDKIADYELSRKFAKEWFDQHGISWFFSNECSRSFAALILEENRLLKEQLGIIQSRLDEVLCTRR